MNFQQFEVCESPPQLWHTGAFNARWQVACGLMADKIGVTFEMLAARLRRPEALACDALRVACLL